MPNWNKFVEDLEKSPKNYMDAILSNLSPPKYVIEKMRKFTDLCAFCWNPRVDLCVNCQKSVCETHNTVIVGEKTKLEWYFCPTCSKTVDMQKFVQQEDERFYLEDQQNP